MENVVLDRITIQRNKFIERIKKSISLNNVVFFIGKYVSDYTANTSQANENQFNEITDMFKKYDATNLEPDNQRLTNKNLDENDELRRNSGKFKDYLKKIGTLKASNMDVIEALGNFNCPIFTTNHDSLLEDVLGKETFDMCQNDELPIKNITGYIVHVYGHYKNNEKVAFDRKSFDNLIQNKTIENNMKKFLQNKTLVFIGYGLAFEDHSFYYLLKWGNKVLGNDLYKLTTRDLNPADFADLASVRIIKFGNDFRELARFIDNFDPRTPIYGTKTASAILKKYLQKLIEQYKHVKVLGNNEEMLLPLEDVFVDLHFEKFDRYAKNKQNQKMKEELRSILFAEGQFDENERMKVNQAYRGLRHKTTDDLSEILLIDSFLDNLLENKIFSEKEATSIKKKIEEVKSSFEDNAKDDYVIESAYNEFDSFIVVGDSGSGKTTLSQWIVFNMARELLRTLFNEDDNEPNKFFSQNERLYHYEAKLPILIPIAEYTNRNKDGLKSLLQFIYEDAAFNLRRFSQNDKKQLADVIMHYLKCGNVLVVFEGLDELPFADAREQLIGEINYLIKYEMEFNEADKKLDYSFQEHKILPGPPDPDVGNRFIITSRIEGNYFNEINGIAKLDIKEISPIALKAFCELYLECIKRKTQLYESIQIENKLYKDIIKDANILRLARNPLLASLIASIYYENMGILPKKRHEIYDKALEELIGRLKKCYDEENKERHFDLTVTNIKFILQNIAEYLHDRAGGINIATLKLIIRECLSRLKNLETRIDDVVNILVKNLKEHSGLLIEFGIDNYKFFNRTFQEYLAGRNILFTQFDLNTQTAICKKINAKVSIPNWREPIKLMFGLLSSTPYYNNIKFEYILYQLLDESRLGESSTDASKILIPIVIIDSLTVIDFENKQGIENTLIERFVKRLLNDYKNISGFSRFKEHQQLIENNILKLKKNYEDQVFEILYNKLNKDKANAPAYANLLSKLDWYDVKFHDFFILNLHLDSSKWDWSIDTLLRDYMCKKEFPLRFKEWLKNNIEYLRNPNWLRLIIVLYGGYQNSEKNVYHKKFALSNLPLSQKEFLMIYHKETQNSFISTDESRDKPKLEIDYFNLNEIYKDSSLTEDIQGALRLDNFLRDLRSKHLDDNGPKVDVLLAHVASGTPDDLKYVKDQYNDSDETFKSCFKNRIQQIISSLAKPLTKCSLEIPKILIKLLETIKLKKQNYDLGIVNYCKIFLYINAACNGLTFDTTKLLESVVAEEEKLYFYTEFFASILTVVEYAKVKDTHKIKESLNGLKLNSNQMLKVFLKLNETIQSTKGEKNYFWTQDVFNFKTFEENDIPIAFFDCLESFEKNLSFIKEWALKIIFNDKLLEKNPALMPLLVLFSFGDMSTNFEKIHKLVCDNCMPDLEKQTNKKNYLLDAIKSIQNPYYKCRGLYQLALYSDRNGIELLRECFDSAKNIENPILQFQVLEKIYHIAIFKDINKQHKKNFMEVIVQHLEAISKQIGDKYERVISLIRLMFYFDSFEREKILTQVFDVLSKMEENNEKYELLCLLKPLVKTYPDLNEQLMKVIDQLKSEEIKNYVNKNYGSILRSALNFQEQIFENNDIIELYKVFALLNEIMNFIDQSDNVVDSMWIELLNNPKNNKSLEEFFSNYFNNQIFLTPKAAIIIDELVNKQEIQALEPILSFLVKPTNKVLPVVYKWLELNNHFEELKNLSALLLVEDKFIFSEAVNRLVQLLNSDDDRLRYRAQRIFQNSVRDVLTPLKRISVIGENALFEICLSRVVNNNMKTRTYLTAFFLDLLWDDAEVAKNVVCKIKDLKESKGYVIRKSLFLNFIVFVDETTLEILIGFLKQQPLPYETYAEEIFISMMRLVGRYPIKPTHEFNILFLHFLKSQPIESFRDQLYLIHNDVKVIRSIIVRLFELVYETRRNKTINLYESIKNYVCSNEMSIPLVDLFGKTCLELVGIFRCNFCVSHTLDKQMEEFFKLIPSEEFFKNDLFKDLLISLIESLKKFEGVNESNLNILITQYLLYITAYIARKNRYEYHKVVSQRGFPKDEFEKTLLTVLDYHPSFRARISAMSLLSNLEYLTQKSIIKLVDTLMDENVVKLHSMSSITLANLSWNIADLLKALEKTNSAVKAYAFLKVIKKYGMNNDISAEDKLNTFNSLMKRANERKSKQMINFYCTDIKLPASVTTLDNELYKTWLDIQGLSSEARVENE